MGKSEKRALFFFLFLRKVNGGVGHADERRAAQDISERYGKEVSDKVRADCKTLRRNVVFFCRKKACGDVIHVCNNVFKAAANKQENGEKEPCDFACSVVGRNCESGDILQENVSLPASVTRDDVLAVLTTGAYNYAMASNYNRGPRPPIVMVNGGTDYLAVRRESSDDLIRNDI